jgi:hypothetical protein
LAASGVGVPLLAPVSPPHPASTSAMPSRAITDNAMNDLFNFTE